MIHDSIEHLLLNVVCIYIERKSARNANALDDAALYLNICFHRRARQICNVCKVSRRCFYVACSILFLLFFYAACSFFFYNAMNFAALRRVVMREGARCGASAPISCRRRLVGARFAVREGA